jgi:hypothetical protein
MDNAARARQRVPAFFLPVTAVLYVSTEALNPKGTDRVITSMATAFKVLPIAARHPAQLYVSGSLSILALGALAVSYAAIAALVRARGSVVATAAALCGPPASHDWSPPSYPLAALGIPARAGTDTSGVSGGDSGRVIML